MYKKTTLDNGVRIVTASLPRRKSVSFGIWINIGGRFEERKQKGIAHFLEHMVFKGSKKFTGEEIKRSIEGIGGSLNGFTSEECTCFLAKIPYYYIKRALAVISDMALNPLIDGNDLEKERSVILEEIRMYRDLPSSYVHDLLDQLLWPNHPLGMPIIGTENSLRHISPKTMLEFKRRFYTASNIVISACGRLNYEKIVDYIKACFGNLERAKKNTFSKVELNQTRPEVNFLTKPIEQTHLAMGFHGLSRDDKDRFALSLVHIILGANMSSRLFCEIREKRGYAYSIATGVKYFSDTGSFLIHAGIQNDKLKDTLEVILKQLERLKKEPIGNGELKRAKEYFIGQLSLSMEDTLDHMIWIGESTLKLNKIYRQNEVIKEIKKITPQRLIQLAKRIFKRSSLNLACIGPLRDKELKEIKNILRCQI